MASKCRAFVQKFFSDLGFTCHIIQSNSFHFCGITSWDMNNPDSEEGAHEMMSCKLTGKTVHDREIPSTSKGEEEGTARQSTEAEIRTALPENMVAPMVLDHFDKSLREFLKQGLVLWDIQRCMKELKTRVGDLERKQSNSQTDSQKEAKKRKISENESESRIDMSESEEKSLTEKEQQEADSDSETKQSCPSAGNLEKLLEDGEISSDDE